MTHAELIHAIQLAWQQLQQQQPLVQCITNTVASQYTANVLLAAGASPAMIDNPFESEVFAGLAAGLIINLGTPTTEQVQAMQLSAKTRQLKSLPWVLDPVGYGPVLKWRSQIADQLLTYHPSVIRGNASEIATLSGHIHASRGVDSTLDSRYAVDYAHALFQHTQVVAISGPSDFIVSPKMTVEVRGGSALQPKVTASGCALGALVAAYSGVTTPFIASIAAHVHFAIAAKRAAEHHPYVGHFNAAFLDQLQALNADDLATADIHLL